MGPIKEFTTAVQAVMDEDEDDDGRMEFAVDGHELVCYPPGDGQLAFLLASMGRHSSSSTQIAGVINFFVAVMDPPSHAYLVDRLLDREDAFGLTEVTAIMEWMVEEWSGRPTQPPSVSTQSRSNGGRRSTRRTSPSISSVSPPTDS